MNDGEVHNLDLTSLMEVIGMVEIPVKKYGQEEGLLSTTFLYGTDESTYMQACEWDWKRKRYQYSTIVFWKSKP